MLHSGTRTALASVVTREFAYGFYVFLCSFVEHNPRAHMPWYIYTRHGEAGLEEGIRDLLLNVYPGLIFHEVKDEQYSRMRDSGLSSLGTPKRLLDAFFIFEAFTLDSYERVICLDADLLCLAPLDELFCHQADFGAVRALQPDTGLPLPHFNSGVLVIGSTHLRGVTYRDLVFQTSLAEADPSKGKADQAVLNEYFYPHRVTWLDPFFNVTKRMFPDDTVKDLPRALRDRPTRILHYVGEKPWAPKVREKERRYSKVERLWWDALLKYASSELLDRFWDARRGQLIDELTVSSQSGRVAPAL